ncbi:MAG TPA: glycosyltransferase [Ilumatobacteraceae bacterium]|nr:glycosyltransferase [Ilumatobacteraceae bacterium]
MELTIRSLTAGLGQLGHAVEVIAPAGSVLPGVVVHQVEGTHQVSSQLMGRDAPIELPARSVLAAMWDRVADLHTDADVVVNLAYDWLPFYLTRWLPTPITHIVSMGSLTDVMDTAIHDVARRHPDRLAAHSHAQAHTYDRTAGDGGTVDAAAATSVPFRILGGGISVEQYAVRPAAGQNPAHLGAVGRISPEKGLEDVAALSAQTGWPVKVWGLMQDPDYWRRVLAEHPGARLEYCGFLSSGELQQAIGNCTALVMTPKWIEAFGLVAVEAMATGVPVVAYDRGGPAEIVVDGETGFVVPADDLDALADAVGRIGTIDRLRCRRRVEAEYSTEAFARRAEGWLLDVVGAAR